MTTGGISKPFIVAAVACLATAAVLLSMDGAMLKLVGLMALMLGCISAVAVFTARTPRTGDHAEAEWFRAIK